VSVGPSGFTAAGLVHLGNVLIPKVLPAGFIDTKDGVVLLKLIFDLVGLCLWGWCIWFFLVSVGAHWKILWPNDPTHKIQFIMTWLVDYHFHVLKKHTCFGRPSALTPKFRYSYVFPNTALVRRSQSSQLYKN
jgi:hypothetical protein